MEFAEVGDPGPAALGWNRLVEVHHRNREQSHLGQRLTEALGTMRQRHAHDIFNSLPDGLAITDREGRITFANKALAAICGNGRNGGALDGETMESCLGLNPRHESAVSLLEPASFGHSVVAEVERSGNGSPRVLRVARHPLRTAESQEGSGNVWSVRDVTQQKLVAKTRDHFLQTAGHELRTPLTNMKAYAETLSLGDKIDFERQKEFCNTINSEATRLARLIDDMLSISSMEVGSLSLARQETDLGRLFSEVIGKVKPEMDQKGVTLEHVFPEKWPKLHLDKDKLVASLVNVLGNAAKYTPSGGRVVLRVSIGDGKLSIVVEDTGLGISEEELPRVFDKFFRSTDPRVQDQVGSGLGLSLVKEVVRMHGGSVDVKSELDAGTVFTITLPVM
jgi:PAS domain S-box-containing protein